VSEISKVDDWSSTELDLQKAYVCSLLSKLAYLYVPENELVTGSRFKVIPCNEYKNIIANRALWINLSEKLDSDYSHRIIETKNLVIILIKFRQTIFVTIRGTQNMYDMFKNIQTWQSAVSVNGGSTIKFHRGFFKVACECLVNLQEVIEDLYDDKSVVFLTGHSLGGAVAAILNAIWSGCGTYLRRHKNILDRKFISSAGCYTFGMPRYGNIHAVEKARTPIHIYKENDFVPEIPPEAFGFHTVPREYRINSQKTIYRSSNRIANPLRFSMRLAKDHAIELYINNIKNTLDYLRNAHPLVKNRNEMISLCTSNALKSLDCLFTKEIRQAVTEFSDLTSDFSDKCNLLRNLKGLRRTGDDRFCLREENTWQVISSNEIRTAYDKICNLFNETPIAKEVCINTLSEELKELSCDLLHKIDMEHFLGDHTDRRQVTGRS
jgi:hypothetical protein